MESWSSEDKMAGSNEEHLIVGRLTLYIFCIILTIFLCGRAVISHRRTPLVMPA